jgi:enoyl-CoA hydratase/carnithine racemase
MTDPANLPVTLTFEGHVAVIEIHRPPHNYIERPITTRIAELLAELDQDDRCRAILLVTEGKNFCAGARHDPDDPVSMAPNLEDIEGHWNTVSRLFASGKPIVAAIQGAAVGAGFGFSMLADFRVATPATRFSANFVKIGFCPGFGLPVTLPRVIGVQRASWMFLTGRRFTAEEVAPWGLVDQIVPTVEELRPAALALATEIAGNAPQGVSFARKRQREGLAEAVRVAQGIDSPEQTRLRLTEDHEEGVRAYIERRPANFTGK